MDSIKIKGHMSAELIKADGSSKHQEKDNIIVAVGFDFIADCMCKTEDRPSPMTHIAVGTGTTASDLSQTTLVNQIGINAATYSHSSMTKTFTLMTTFTPGSATGSITEAGVFNNVSGGIMLDRVVFDEINKAEADTLNIQFTFTLS